MKQNWDYMNLSINPDDLPTKEELIGQLKKGRRQCDSVDRVAGESASTIWE